jgi:hypothetical protein
MIGLIGSDDAEEQPKGLGLGHRDDARFPWGIA